MGVPAAAFDVGGIRDWLIDGQTGALAPGDPPTAAGLATAIVACVHDETRRAALGAAARTAATSAIARGARRGSRARIRAPDRRARDGPRRSLNMRIAFVVHDYNRMFGHSRYIWSWPSASAA